MPEGRSGYGVKVTLMPRPAYEALHRNGRDEQCVQTQQTDPADGR
ncbi:hypothetical protein ACH4ZX_12475 [Streptomyces sp. NPDC020490]